MLIEGKRNRGLFGQSGESDLQLGPDNELLVSNVRSKYGALARAGRILTSCNVTAGSSGLTPGTALTTTSPFGLWNPPNNTYNLEVLDVSVGYVSGTMGAGAMYLCWEAVAVTATPTGTACNSVNALGGPNGAAVGNPSYGYHTLSSLNGSPLVLFPFLNFGPYLATSVLSERGATFNVEGRVVVTPGALLRVCSVATAGTSPLVNIAMTFALVDR